MREIYDPQLFAYCEEHTTPVDDLLIELERHTHLSTVAPQMIAGRYQGKLLEMITRMCSPRRALEIGTFTGYGTISIARGLPADGKLDTIEINPERRSIISEFVRRAGLETKVQLHIGNALELIPDLEDQFQLIYIDAAKRDNAKYISLCLPKLDIGGILVLDNVLWGGKVVTDPEDNDAIAIDAINKRLASDPSLQTVMLPVRDGISIVMKV